MNLNLQFSNDNVEFILNEVSDLTINVTQLYAYQLGGWVHIKTKDRTRGIWYRGRPNEFLIEGSRWTGTAYNLYLYLQDKFHNGSGGGTGGTDDYRDLLNKPKINTVELVGNKTSSDLGLQPTLVGTGTGQNIKTINRTNLLGTGDISLQTPLTFDTAPTASSTNPVTSAGIKTYVDNAVDAAQRDLTVIHDTTLLGTGKEGDPLKVVQNYITKTTARDALMVVDGLNQVLKTLYVEPKVLYFGYYGSTNAQGLWDEFADADGSFYKPYSDSSHLYGADFGNYTIVILPSWNEIPTAQVGQTRSKSFALTSSIGFGLTFVGISPNTVLEVKTFNGTKATFINLKITLPDLVDASYQPVKFLNCSISIGESYTILPKFANGYFFTLESCNLTSKSNTVIQFVNSKVEISDCTAGDDEGGMEVALKFIYCDGGVYDSKRFCIIAGDTSSITTQPIYVDKRLDINNCTLYNGIDQSTNTYIYPIKCEKNCGNVRIACCTFYANSTSVNDFVPSKIDINATETNQLQYQISVFNTVFDYDATNPLSTITDVNGDAVNHRPFMPSFLNVSNAPSQGVFDNKARAGYSLDTMGTNATTSPHGLDNHLDAISNALVALQNSSGGGATLYTGTYSTEEVDELPKLNTVQKFSASHFLWDNNRVPAKADLVYFDFDLSGKVLHTFGVVEAVNEGEFSINITFTSLGTRVLECEYDTEDINETPPPINTLWVIPREKITFISYPPLFKGDLLFGTWKNVTTSAETPFVGVFEEQRSNSFRVRLLYNGLGVSGGGGNTQQMKVASLNLPISNEEQLPFVNQNIIANKSNVTFPLGIDPESGEFVSLVINATGSENPIAWTYLAQIVYSTSDDYYSFRPIYSSRNNYSTCYGTFAALDDDNAPSVNTFWNAPLPQFNWTNGRLGTIYEGALSIKGTPVIITWIKGATTLTVFGHVESNNGGKLQILVTYTGTGTAGGGFSFKSGLYNPPASAQRMPILNEKITALQSEFVWDNESPPKQGELFYLQINNAFFGASPYVCYSLSDFTKAQKGDFLPIGQTGFNNYQYRKGIYYAGTDKNGNPELPPPVNTNWSFDTSSVEWVDLAPDESGMLSKGTPVILDFASELYNATVYGIVDESYEHGTSIYVTYTGNGTERGTGTWTGIITTTTTELPNAGELITIFKSDIYFTDSPTYESEPKKGDFVYLRITVADETENFHIFIFGVLYSNNTDTNSYTISVCDNGLGQRIKTVKYVSSLVLRPALNLAVILNANDLLYPYGTPQKGEQIEVQYMTGVSEAPIYRCLGYVADITWSTPTRISTFTIYYYYVGGGVSSGGGSSFSTTINSGVDNESVSSTAPTFDGSQSSITLNNALTWNSKFYTSDTIVGDVSTTTSVGLKETIRGLSANVKNLLGGINNYYSSDDGADPPSSTLIHGTFPYYNNGDEPSEEYKPTGIGLRLTSKDSWHAGGSVDATLEIVGKVNSGIGRDTWQQRTASSILIKDDLSVLDTKSLSIPLIDPNYSLYPSDADGQPHWTGYLLPDPTTYRGSFNYTSIVRVDLGKEWNCNTTYGLFLAICTTSASPLTGNAYTPYIRFKWHNSRFIPISATGVLPISSTPTTHIGVWIGDPDGSVKYRNHLNISVTTNEIGTTCSWITDYGINIGETISSLPLGSHTLAYQATTYQLHLIGGA